MENLLKGIRCSEGENILKLERLVRVIQSDSGDQVINLEKVKAYCDGPLPKFMSIFGVFRKVLQFVPLGLRCYRCQRSKTYVQ